MEKRLYTVLKNCESYACFECYLKSMENGEKGDLFECFCKYVLLLHPDYEFDKVYLYDDIPYSIREKFKLPDIDKGLDLLCIKQNCHHYGVQCKFRSDKNKIISWKELSTYPAMLFKCDINYGIFMTNGNDICEELKNTNKIINIYGSFWKKKINKQFIYKILNKIRGNCNILNKINENWEELMKYKPYAYQQEIINKTVEHYQTKNKGKIIMACGTGKTLTSYFCVEKLNYKKVIVIVPSLYLLSQFYMEWSSQMDMVSLLIGSDCDQKISDTLGFIITTSEEKIIEWIEKHKEAKYIFTTYQSADKLKNAIIKTKSNFDICIFDEAHKTTGVHGHGFATFLEEMCYIKKKMFLTATPKVYESNCDQVYSMDNIEQYGETIVDISLSKAIKMKLLTDYQIITPITNNKQIEQFLEVNDIVLCETDKYDSYSISASIVLLKSIQKYNNIRKILTYHRTINESLKFCKILKILIDKLKLEINITHLDGTFSMTKKKNIIREFEESKMVYVICSAKVLSEGIDIKCVDTVVFVSPKKSIVDIIQCIGRCLRLYNGKIISNILVPVIITNLDEDDNYSNLWNIIRAIDISDKSLMEYVVLKNKGVSRGRKFNWNIDPILNETKLNPINYQEWYESIKLIFYKRLDIRKLRKELLFEYCDIYKKVPIRTTKYKKQPIGKWFQTQKTKINSSQDKAYILLSKMNMLRIR